MEHNPPKQMTPFDNLTTPHGLYALKLMLPYTPASIQRTLGIYIKFSELRYTMEYFHGFGNPDSSKIFDTLKDYMGPEEKEMMEQMEMMMNMMEMTKGQSDMADMLGGMFGDMFHMPEDDPQDGPQKGEAADE